MAEVTEETILFPPEYTSVVDDLEALLWDQSGNVNVPVLKVLGLHVPPQFATDFVCDMHDLIRRMEAEGKDCPTIVRQILFETLDGSNVHGEGIPDALGPPHSGDIQRDLRRQRLVERIQEAVRGLELPTAIQAWGLGDLFDAWDAQPPMKRGTPRRKPMEGMEVPRLMWLHLYSLRTKRGDEETGQLLGRLGASEAEIGATLHARNAVASWVDDLQREIEGNELCDAVLDAKDEGYFEFLRCMVKNDLRFRDGISLSHERNLFKQVAQWKVGDAIRRKQREREIKRELKRRLLTESQECDCPLDKMVFEEEVRRIQAELVNRRCEYPNAYLRLIEWLTWNKIGEQLHIPLTTAVSRYDKEVKKLLRKLGYDERMSHRQLEVGWRLWGS